MVCYGEPPFLECSSRGDKRFSAFYARIKKRGNKTIEELYQAYKIFEDGSTNLNWRQAKGKKALNHKDASAFYHILWCEYIFENQHLLYELRKHTGLSDVFGKKDSCCQARSLWIILGNIVER